MSNDVHVPGIGLLGPTTEEYVNSCLEFIKGKGRVCTTWTFFLSEDKIALLENQIKSKNHFNFYFQIKSKSVMYKARVIGFLFSRTEIPSPAIDYTPDYEPATGNGWYTIDNIEPIIPGRPLGSFQLFDKTENLNQRMYSRMKNPKSEFFYVLDNQTESEETPQTTQSEPLIMLLEGKKQIVFYGPPGTGKTWFAKRFADHFLEKQKNPL